MPVRDHEKVALMVCVLSITVANVANETCVEVLNSKGTKAIVSVRPSHLATIPLPFPSNACSQSHFNQNQSCSDVVADV